MKCYDHSYSQGLNRSLPPRGAWIEILIYDGDIAERLCRSPHGERGLKLLLILAFPFAVLSLPPRGAWIEIFAISGVFG